MTNDYFLLICAICWIKYYILLPHSTVGNHNQCCILAVSFLPNRWGAMSAQNAFRTQYATSSQVWLQTHTNTLCAVPVHYTWILQTL